MRKVLITILCLCSFLSVASASEKPLMLGALRGPSHDAAIALAAELSETLKRPVMIKAFEDEATMYVWLERYRMIDFAFSSSDDLAPGYLHRLGPVAVADGASSTVLVGHGGLPREVLLQVQEVLTGESRRPVTAALLSEPDSAEDLTSEPEAATSATAGGMVPAAPKTAVEVNQAVQENLPDADNVTGLLSHWGLAEDVPGEEGAPLAGEDDVLTLEGLSPDPENKDAVTQEFAAVSSSPEALPVGKVAAEEQSSWGGIGEMLNHWGASAEDPPESGLAATEENPQPSAALSATPAGPVEAAEKASGDQSRWGGVGDLLTHWGLSTGEASAPTPEDQAGSIATVVMNAPQPSSFDAPVEVGTPEPVPAGPLIVHLIPLTRVMIPERVENRLLEEFSRLLQQQDRVEQVRFVEHDKPLSQIEPSWLKQHHSLAGEIFSYQEKIGRFSTSVRMRGRFYYRSPAQADSPWQKEVPVKVSFDPNDTTLEEAQEQLVVELATALAEAFFAEISPE